MAYVKLSILIILLRQSSMNFFNENFKLQKRKLANRAYEQLSKRIHHRLSFTKSEPKQTKIDDRYPGQFKNMKNQSQKVAHVTNEKRTNSCVLGSTNKQLSNPVFKRSNKSSSEAITNTKTNEKYVNQNQKFPDSFSSYLVKNKSRLNGKKSKNKLNLRYFDLDQIANHLASPIKLENKIQMQDQTIQKRKNQLLTLKHFHGFLSNVEKDKAQYDQFSKNKKHQSGVKTEAIVQQKSLYLIKKQISWAENHSIWRKNVQNRGNKGLQNIIPWTGNEQEYSPLIIKRNRGITKGMEYCEAQIFNLNK